MSTLQKAPPAVKSMQVATAANLPVPQKPLELMEIGEVGKVQMEGMSGVTQRLMTNAKGSDLDEMGKLVGNLLVAAKGYDPKTLGKGGLFTWGKTKAQQFQNRFTTVDTQVNQLVGQIDQRTQHFRSRVPDLESMRVDTIKFHDDLGDQIEEMNRRIEWMELNPPSVDPNDPMDGQKLATWNQVIQLGRKRADDLRRVQFLAQQALPQIEQSKVNCAMLVQKFSDIKATTIPAWQQLLAAYIIQLEIQKGVEMTENIDDAFNEAVKKSSDLNRSNSVRVATSLARSSIDMSTLQHTQQNLLATIDEVKNIALQGQQRLAQERPMIEQMSKELSNKLSKR